MRTLLFVTALAAAAACQHSDADKAKDKTAEKDDVKIPDLTVDDVAKQVEEGSNRIFGVMLESNLVEGRQDYVPGKPAVYGQSITDACLSLEQTEPILEMLACAQLKRKR